MLSTTCRLANVELFYDRKPEIESDKANKNGIHFAFISQTYAAIILPASIVFSVHVQSTLEKATFN